MPIPFRLDYVIERTLAEASSERRALKELTGLKLSVAEARKVWPLILEHKWYISERLGRDVGLRVAAIDYFSNIRPPLTLRRTKDTLPARLRMMQPLSMGV
ncbi:MAG: DUF4032 domain-containing protein [Pyrinomonadaceae bacterium]